MQRCVKTMERSSKSILETNKFLRSTQLFIIASAVLIALIITVVCVGLLMRYEVNSDVSSIKDIPFWEEQLANEQRIWYKKGIEELWNAINIRTNKDRASNCIIFMANGLSPDVLSGVRLDDLQNATDMSWDNFPYLGMLKHHCSDTGYCDLLSLGTAIFGGVRTTAKLGGLDSSVPLRSCSAALNPAHHIQSILEIAQTAGKRTGFITTGRVSAAPIAALYAKVADSNWECDDDMTMAQITEGCSDIARELVKNSTGQKINVIMGGGRQTLVSNVPSTKSDPIDLNICNSNDNRNLIEDWQKQKISEEKSYAVLHNDEDLKMLNGSKSDYVFGVFSNGNMRNGHNMAPTLGDMVNKSLLVLQRQKQSYFLVVNEEIEPSTPRKSQFEILKNFNKIIENTLEATNRNSEKTLFLILFNTAVTPSLAYLDHGLMEGKDGGNTKEFKSDTLIFAIGGSSCCAYDDAVDLITKRCLHVETGKGVDEGGSSCCAYDDAVDLITKRCLHVETGKGVDEGPQSYLFQGMHDDTYVAQAIAYAMRIGPFSDEGS